VIGRAAVVGVALVGVVAVVLRCGADPLTPALIALVVLGVPLAAVDLRSHRLPTPLVWRLGAVLVAALAAASLSTGPGPFFAALGGAALYGGVFLAAHLVRPHALGFGDVRLATVLGLPLGWLGLRPLLDGMLAGLLLGSVAGLAVLAVRRDRRAAVPLGPAMLAGALGVALVLGPVS
jgi:leader peptidase (prepilin peptidase)/N-methyltransferase